MAPASGFQYLWMGGFRYVGALRGFEHSEGQVIEIVSQDTFYISGPSFWSKLAKELELLGGAHTHIVGVYFL